MAVRVRFPFPLNEKSSDLIVEESFMHYFAEEELVKVKEGPVAFDGMSCTEFKLKQLETGNKRQIASFEPGLSKDES